MYAPLFVEGENNVIASLEEVLTFLGAPTFMPNWVKFDMLALEFRDYYALSCMGHVI